MLTQRSTLPSSRKPPAQTPSIHPLAGHLVGSFKCTTAERHHRVRQLHRMCAYHLGMDFGTSGARATVIDSAGQAVHDAKLGYGPQASSDWATAWERVLYELISSIPAELRAELASIAIDGTSATAMLLDKASGQVLAPAKLYNESQPEGSVAAAKEMAPPQHTATASTSTLCKLLTWHQQGMWQAAQEGGQQPGLLHQADWLASLLHGRRDVSDWNNALKLGYDPGCTSYPQWLTDQEFAALLPMEVVAPGQAVATVMPAVARTFGLPAGCTVCGGTTDSIAAFVAAGVSEPGQAVTSLGSTLAVKLLSESRVDDASYGVYSHRLGDSWLVGGASNSGGAVLRQLFSDQQLTQLSAAIDPSQASPLDYYPLPAPGERFPVNDPLLAPRLEPRPEDDTQFLHGVLESIARIEGRAYALLQQLGSSPLREVYTAGGGAQNPQWSAIRQRVLGVPVKVSPQQEASYGAALLARQGAQQQQKEQE